VFVEYCHLLVALTVIYGTGQSNQQTVKKLWRCV